MSNVKGYDELLRELAHLSREEFLREVDVPYLFIDAAAEIDLPGLFRTVQLVTGKPTGDTPSDDTPSRPFTPTQFVRDIDQQYVIPVRKDAKSNAFAMMITLGRAGNNDLTLPDKLISKFHCYFRRVRQAWTITDANSTNGTQVEGERLTAERMYPLRSGSTIELAGSLRLMFLEPSELYDLLQYSKALVAGRGWSPSSQLSASA